MQRDIRRLHRLAEVAGSVDMLEGICCTYRFRDMAELGGIHLFIGLIFATLDNGDNYDVSTVRPP